MTELLERPPGHAFISYVREDGERADRLATLLADAGIRVWRDVEDLWPGQDWKIQIRNAITNDSLAFLACFSTNSNNRDTTYQNEELILAAEQMRLRSPGRSWLVPVRFDSCQIPYYDLGAGRSFDSLQRVDLSDGEWRGAGRLIAAVATILSVEAPPASHIVESDPRPSSPAARVRSTLLKPEMQIELEDAITQVAVEVKSRLADEGYFPGSSDKLTNDLAGVRFLASQAHAYFDAVKPVATVLAVGCSYGLAVHNPLWARVVQGIARANKRRSGSTALVELQYLPLITTIYSGSIAAVHRRNYGALKAVTVDATYRSDHNERNPAIGLAHPWIPFQQADVTASLIANEAEGKPKTDDELSRMMQRGGKRHTPLSDYLHAVLWPVFSDLIPDEEEYTEHFDATEVLLGVIAAHEKVKAHEDGRYIHGPWYGSFTWRDRHGNLSIEERLRQEIEREGASWQPLTAGLFDGSAEKALAAAQSFVDNAGDARSRRW